MNQHLKTIQDLLQQTKSLSEADKEALLKSITDADKQWAITDFKLDRTEKVKKTTAILLEETIEELEQKRKAVEAQNQELAIESALERVRTVAMSMMKPDDLLSICKAQFTELKHLGFTELRNSLIDIFDDERNYLTDYDYSDFLGGTIQKIPYNEYPVIDRSIKQLKSATNAFTEFVVEGEGLEEWKAFRKQNGEDDDTRIKDTDALYYYFYSISHGNIGISTFKKISEGQLTVLKRFRNVFDLAYKRYVDISKAEAQAREAKIEAALEKVRSRSMGMQKSEELTDVIQVVYQQFGHLNIHIEHTGFIIDYKARDDMNIWLADQREVPSQVTIPYFDCAHWNSFNEAKEKGLDFFANHLSFEEKNKFYQDLFTLFPVPDETKEYYFNCPGLAISTVLLENVGLYIENFSGIPYTDEENNILMRFGKVFQQTYTRFNDLQKAEAQAREAKIEAALERTRTQSMIMQHSNELDDCLRVFHEQILLLGIQSEFSYLWLPDEDKDRHIFWAAWAENFLTGQPGKNNSIVFKSKAVNYPLDRSEPATAQCLVDWKSDESIYSYVIPPAGVENYFATWKELLEGVERLKPAYFQGGLYYVEAFMKYGCFGVVIKNELSDDEKKILGRFSVEFERTYTRFLDLQKAEAQAREAQIEAALEKVRSRSLAMNTTNELGEVVKVIVEKLQDLGVVLDANGVVLCTYFPDSKNVLHWIVSPDYSMTGSYLLPYFDHPIFNAAWHSKESGDEYFSEAFSVEEKNSFFEYAFEHSDYKHFPEDFKQWIFQNDKHILSFAWQKNSAILIPSHTGVVPNDAEKAILIRFAKVFEQAYVRFLDLQNAEAQARESQIQLAMERVRARTMAMQRSDELANVATVLFQQVKALGVPQWLCGFSIWEIGDKEFTWYPGSPDGDILPPSKIPLTEHPVFISFDESRRRGDELFVYEKEGEFQAGHYRYMQSLPGLRELLQNMLDAGLSFPTFQIDHIANFSHGNLAFITYEHFPEMHDVFKRFAKVFEQTYTRFLDLQKAEAQAREAQIEAALEKVRSRSMGMQKSEELKEVIQVVYEQFVHLNINTEHTGFVMDYKERDDRLIWVASKYGVPSRLTIPYFDCEYYNRFNEAKEKGWDFFATNLSFEEKNKFYKQLFTHIPGLPDEAKEFYFNCPGLAISTVLLENVGLYIENFEGIPYSDEDNALLMRFGKVFQQTYTRFLDLEKAEAQAKEAQIEAALERVRARTMAMHKSSDLLDVVKILGEQFELLGFKFDSVNFNTDYKANDFNLWLYNVGSAMYPGIIHIPYIDHPCFNRVLEALRKGADLQSFIFTKEEKDSFFDHIYTNSVAKYGSDERKKYTYAAPGMAMSVAVSKNTSVTIINYDGRAFREDENTILQRFAKVFEQTYTRFLDLQKAEAQTREAQIEAALERVRSRTLAMQKSDELAETAAVVFRQLITLGIAPNRLYIAIIKDENGQAEFWITDEDGSKISYAYEANLNDNPSFKKMLQGWKEEKKSLIIDMRGEELREYFKYLTSINVPFKGGLAQKRRVQDIAYFGKGFIGIASPDEQPQETIALLERFAAVFNLTYTRFNDLQIAEAHAFQAEQDLIEIKAARKKAEETLVELQATQKQLIQSEKMASLGELTAGIAHEIQNPLNFVNNFSDVSSELLEEMKTELEKGNKEDAMAIVEDVKQNLEKILHHGKRADAIVKGMLQHSRSGSGQKELTDINTLADEYLRLAYHGLRAKDKSFNATLNHDFDRSIEKINLIPQDIGRVLVNLINNAFYAVNEKTKQHIPGYEPATIITKKVGDKAELRVMDNGNGIPQKVLDKIFQPFFTTKPTGQGTGLGLSLAYDIITKGHGGELKVETKEGEGSEFIIQLPV